MISINNVSHQDHSKLLAESLIPYQKMIKQFSNKHLQKTQSF